MTLEILENCESFSGRVQTSFIVTLVEDNEVISNDTAIAETFNEYFIKITGTIDIGKAKFYLPPTDSIEDHIAIAITKYNLHPCVKRIQDNFNPSRMFDFTLVSMEDMYTQQQRLDPEKAAQLESIPAKILKESSDVFLPYLSSNFSLCLVENYFRNELKNGDIVSLEKKDDVLSKENYRPITLLSSASKIFERLLYDELMKFAVNFLLPLLCILRNGYNTQHALLRFLETCKMTLDKSGYAGALLMDLSKAFDCIDHELLIAELHPYEFNTNALKMIYSYLSKK